MLPEVLFGDSAIFMSKTHTAQISSLFFSLFFLGGGGGGVVYGNVLNLHFLE